ncbi:MAG: hypothetical protein IT445_18155 [Phycisphaeraceae bacterium]|nr:hypothetical protein [Phycisphaeraceae bacterium]
MQIFIDLIVGTIHLIRAGVDIVIVFLLAHAMSQRWPNRFLLALDGAGRPLVDTVLEAMTSQVQRIYEGNLSLRMRLTICMTVLVAIHAICSIVISIIQ